MLQIKKEQVDREIRKFKEEYVSDDMSDFEIEMEIIKWMVQNIEYDYNYTSDYNNPCYTAYGALVNHLAVCNGYAEGFDEMCNAFGIESELVIGKIYYPSDPDTLLDHAWNVAKLVE